MPGNSKLKADISSITHTMVLIFSHACKKRMKHRKTLSCVCFAFCFLFCFYFLVLSIHVITLALLPFWKFNRIWDYTYPVLLFLVNAEQALSALSAQITAMLLCALVCLATKSSVLTYHLSLRPEKEIILAFLLLVHTYKSVIYDMSAALKLAQNYDEQER